MRNATSATTKNNSYTPPISAQHTSTHTSDSIEQTRLPAFRCRLIPHKKTRMHNMFPRHSILKCANIVRRAVNQQSRLSVHSICMQFSIYAVLEPIYIYGWYFYTFIHVIISDILSWLASSQLPISFGRIRPLAPSSTAASMQSPYTARCWTGTHTISAMQCTYTFMGIGVRVRVN